MNNISFQQIEAFLAVAKNLNLSKAGEAKSISQSALSKMLKRFEKAVGMQLFERSHLGMSLTSAGEELYVVLEAQYNALDRGIRLAQNSTASQTAVLRIIEPSSYDYAEEFEYLKSIVRLYADKYPEVEIQELQCDFKELRQALEYGGTDLVFSQEFVITDIQNIAHKRLSEVNMYITMSGKHPLAQCDDLDYSMLENEVFLTARTTGSEQTDIEGMHYVCQLLGFTPKAIKCLPNFETFLYAVKHGNGMGICGRFKHIGREGDIKYFPVAQLRNLHVLVAWKPGTLTREAQNFIDMLPDEHLKIS